MTETQIIRTGACECGAAEYGITGGVPIHVYACHCLNCQTRSGSAFALHAILPTTEFREPADTLSHRRQSDGIEFEEVFCAHCFTRLFNRNSAVPGMIFLRAGTLDDSDNLSPIAHIWTSRMQSWISLPEGTAQFQQSPTPEQFGEAIRQADSG
ncbi:GFA family protein [Paracoccus albus]|uniref:GFA family protein n=1 Tax=Paracoccus albus TaxID=3017784 RepID=UPI0022F0CD69|nr:GFA family protein [Paracoccus albus]WBU61074.1 GFA family protein [Paracoccus albus]